MRWFVRHRINDMRWDKMRGDEMRWQLYIMIINSKRDETENNTKILLKGNLNMFHSIAYSGETLHFAYVTFLSTHAFHSILVSTPWKHHIICDSWCCIATDWCRSIGNIAQRMWGRQHRIHLWMAIQCSRHTHLSAVEHGRVPSEGRRPL